MNRRNFLGAAAAGTAAMVFPGEVAAAARWTPRIAQTAIPRWRGFNLLDLFQALPREGRYTPAVTEDECRWIRDWGFNFIRIPMDYWFWIDTDWRNTKSLTPDDTLRIKESALDPVDRLIDLGQKYGLHVSLNLHRAPGYCINNPEREPFVLWSDPRAEDAFVTHWAYFAERYKDVSEYDLSFNLVNEAPSVKEGYMSRADYVRVMTRATDKIRSITPRRIVIIDGLGVGNKTVDEMIPSGVAQSVHAYTPAQITHYRASWVDKTGSFPDPQWPMKAEDGSITWGRERLEAHYAPWAELAKKGIGVHCGEAGCYSKTPHKVVLAWFEDTMDILAKHGIGYALWNFRGAFGILDSGREDVDYENWNGAKLDRKLLTLLQRY